MSGTEPRQPDAAPARASATGAGKSSLTATAWRLYDHLRRQRWTEATIDRLALRIGGGGDQAVRRGLKQLQQAGLIEVERRSFGLRISCVKQANFSTDRSKITDHRSVENHRSQPSLTKNINPTNNVGAPPRKAPAHTEHFSAAVEEWVRILEFVGGADRGGCGDLHLSPAGEATLASLGGVRALYEIRRKSPERIPLVRRDWIESYGLAVNPVKEKARSACTG